MPHTILSRHYRTHTTVDKTAPYVDLSTGQDTLPYQGKLIPGKLIGPSVIATDTRVYVLGGYSAIEGFSQSVHTAPILQDNTIGGWARCSSLAVAASHMGALAHKGRVYLFGGACARGYSNELWVATILSGGLLGGWRSTPLPGYFACAKVLSRGDYIHLLSAISPDGHTSRSYSAKTRQDGTVAEWLPSEQLPFAPKNPYVLERAECVRLVGQDPLVSEEEQVSVEAGFDADGAISDWSVALCRPPCDLILPKVTTSHGYIHLTPA